MAIIQVGQDQEMFGNMESPYFFLKAVSESYPETKQDFDNLKKAIDIFNSVGIEIDISLRYNTAIFNKTD